MRSINRKVLFQVRTGKTLRLRIKWENYREVFVSVGYVVDADKFESGRCRQNTTHGAARIPAMTVNKAIEDMLDKVNDVFYAFEMKDQVPTPELFMKSIKGEKIETSVSLEVAWTEFLREGEVHKQWSYNTVKSYRQVQNLFDKFFPKMRFDGLTLAVLQRFEELQQSSKLSCKNYKKNPSGYANNVIEKNCHIFKRFLKWCVKKDYISSSIVESWHPNLKSITRPVVFLTWDELMRLYNLDLSGDKMKEDVRNIFCFMCFTSLRFSDAIGLKKSQIHDGYIHVTTQKTSKNIVIELNDYSKSILAKYEDLEGDLVFPAHNNFNVNYHLKLIGAMAKINEPMTISQYFGSKRIDKTLPKHEFLSTHCGRRTFVCNALAMGIPAHVVIKWTGHADLAAMRPYIDVADNVRKSEMERFNRK